MNATEQIVYRACLRKVRMGRHAAMLVAQAKRNRGESYSAYRCPFSNGPGRSDEHWHVGHIPGMEAVANIALAIRDTHGNAPEPLVSCAS